MSLSPAEHARWLRKVADAVEERAQRVIVKVAETGAQMARRRTYDVRAVDTRRFAESWRAERRQGGAAVRDTAPHAPYAESGRDPGDPPPIAALIRWVERRLGLGGPRARMAALRIAAKIAKRGQEGAQILVWLRPRLVKMVEDKVAQEVSDAHVVR